MNTHLTPPPTYSLRMAYWLALPLSLCIPAFAASTPAAPLPGNMAAFQPAAASTVPLGNAASAPLAATPAPIPTPIVAAAETCRPVTDQAMAADMKAVTAQSQKLELPEQARLYDSAVTLWSQAADVCEGRAKERAQRNAADSQKMRAAINAQLGAGPECAAAHRDAGAFQDIAKQALGERRWTDASMLFRKAETMWDAASERCSGPLQEAANRHREQSEVDGYNAEFCAPLFETARDQTQKVRAAGSSLTREEKQDASQVAETLWREAGALCKGTVVQEAARGNAQAIARERGTPWVARTAPATQPESDGKTPPVLLTAKTATPVLPPAPAAGFLTLKPEAAKLAVAALALQDKTPALPAAVGTEGTRMSGQFVLDADGITYSGTGKVVWAKGDVYEGTLVKGQRHGKGLFVWANGQRYDGDWVHDKPTGQASVRFANGNQYDGSVVDGIPEGTGRMRYASGDSYSGQFKAGDPEGSGAYAWKNGQQYDGEWKNARPNGQGKLRFANGDQYEGAVKDGAPIGQGRMVSVSGDVYTGNYSAAGKPDGLGTIVWNSGDQYTGQWKAGKKHGQGVFSWKSGERWEGIYDNDEQVGQTLQAQTQPMAVKN